MAKSYTVRNFSGGMNDWLHPSLLPENTASGLSNAEVSDGKLSPIRRPLLLRYSDPTLYGHYGTRDRSVVKWYNRYYWSENEALTSPYYGGNEENYLGLPYPKYSGSGANVTITASNPETGESGLSGSYKYCVCYVNANGWEGAPGSLEEYEKAVELSGKWGKVTVTWSDTRISYAKVYRTGANGADFYCVGEIRESGGNLIDKTEDDLLVMLNGLESEENYPPPDGGRYLTEYGGVFFLAVGSVLYFSRQGNPHAWPTVQFLSFDDTITGVVPEFQGILVFTRNNAYRVTGAENAETITKTYIPGNHGCLNFRSISAVNNAPIWLSNDGICLWDGSSVGVPSYQVKTTRYIGVKYAVSANDKYYLFLTSRCIVFDRKNGDIFYELDLTCDYAWYDADGDELYLQIGGGLYQYGAGESMTFRYESGHIGESELTWKKFLELWTMGDGEHSVRVLVDGEEKVSWLKLPGGRNRVKLPLSAVGKYLELKILGKSKLNEYGVIYE